MGRIYDVETTPHVRAYWPGGAKMTGAFRVEFDGDTDEGMATVSLYLKDDDGQIIIDHEANCAIKVQVRLFTRVRHKPAPDNLPPLNLVMRGPGGDPVETSQSYEAFIAHAAADGR